MNFASLIISLTQITRCCGLSFFRASGDYQDAPLLSAIIDNTYDDDNETFKNGEENIGEELGDVITLVLGGYHTTGYGLTWVLYYMTVYPEVSLTKLIKLSNCQTNVFITMAIGSRQGEDRNGASFGKRRPVSLYAITIGLHSSSY